VPDSILKKGRNCRELAATGRAAVVVDGRDYYRAFKEALEGAKRQVFIMGWDIDSRVKLLRGEDGDGPTLGQFVDRLAHEREHLDIYVLSWDFAVLYTLDRETLPKYKLGFKTHPRVHFRLDGEHPLGASHHQKVVVVDDRMAFSGGLDLTRERWDTSQHLLDDERRVKPDGEPYHPFHDIQMAVEGEAARALGDLCRERWLMSTGEKIEPAEATGEDDIWPASLEPDFRDVEVGISLTVPAFKSRPEVREVETLYVDAIMAARDYIYIENQYFSSNTIRKVLLRRLAQEDCPEILVILPLHSTGWLAQNIMDAIRARYVDELRRADKHGRITFCRPHSGAGDSGFLMVHAKMFIADHAFLRVGSSNLSNRSMGLDTECDLCLEAGGRDDVAEGIRGIRDRLLAEHLGVAAEEVARAVDEHGSMAGAVAALSGEGKTLVRLDVEQDLLTRLVSSEAEKVDPERPFALDRVMDEFARENGDHEVLKGFAKIGGVAAVLLGLAATWRWTPLGDYLTAHRIAAWAAAFSHLNLAPAVMIGIYVVGSLVMFPVTALVVATAIVFDPWQAFGYTLAGTQVSAALTYWLGRKLGQESLRRVAGDRVNRVSRQLANHGILAVAVVRNLPVAPFTVINLASGASHISFRDYALGTLLGMVPGIAAVTVFTDSLLDFVQDPEWSTLGVLVLVGVLFLGGSWWLGRRLSHRWRGRRRKKPEHHGARKDGQGGGADREQG
jgi:phosphatidylserine/phosphatidylglycerophosphate/cardiolipin synthase-like enzyme/uncharacterized membrane protein YdjX (TVP38/TMEM64 family)